MPGFRKSGHNFLRNGAFCTYVAQHSVFPYTLRITPRGLSKITNLPGKKAKDEAIKEAIKRSYKESDGRYAV